MEIEKENINNNQYNPLDELIKFYNNKYEEKKKDLLDESIFKKF